MTKNIHKKSIFQLLVFLAVFIAGCSTAPWQNDVEGRNALNQYVQNELVSFSVFPMKVTLEVSFKDATKEVPIQAIKSRCGLFGTGAVFSFGKNDTLLTVKHNLTGKVQACAEGIEKEITAKGLSISLNDILIVPSYSIIGSDGKDYMVVPDKVSETKDLATLKITDKGSLKIKPLFLSDETTVIPQEVAAIGSPIGIKNVTVYGNIARKDLVNGMILSSVSVYPGNSGGPMISLKDMKVLGIIADVIQSGTGQMLNFGTAIPVWEVKAFLRDSGAEE